MPITIANLSLAEMQDITFHYDELAENPQRETSNLEEVRDNLTNEIERLENRYQYTDQIDPSDQKDYNIYKLRRANINNLLEARRVESQVRLAAETPETPNQISPRARGHRR